ncbi:MAG: hypothetical protein UX30_C0022G0003 [Candidatus Saccharibacteria bacterium GW2011_GWA2_46_10]|nr:MAG: hypothetical protein UX30_C0022G0003 [Candidatus Saccharibacteria bacterium GW2011_GWA2_46_10]
MAQHRSLIVFKVVKVEWVKADNWEKEEGKKVANVYYDLESIKGIGEGVTWAESIQNQGGGVGGPWVHVRGIPEGKDIKSGHWIVYNFHSGRFESINESEPFFTI